MKITTDADLTLFDASDNENARIKLRIEIEFTAGMPEYKPHGRWTEPEEYDPGSGDEVHVLVAWRVRESAVVRANDDEMAWARTWAEQNDSYIALLAKQEAA